MLLRVQMPVGDAAVSIPTNGYPFAEAKNFFTSNLYSFTFCPGTNNDKKIKAPSKPATPGLVSLQ